MHLGQGISVWNFSTSKNSFPRYKGSLGRSLKHAAVHYLQLYLTCLLAPEYTVSQRTGINEWELLHLYCKTLLGINSMSLCRGPEGLTAAGSTNTSSEAAAMMVTPLQDTPVLVKYFIYFSMVQQWKSYFDLYRKSKLDSELRAVRDGKESLSYL